VQALYYF